MGKKRLFKLPRTLVIVCMSSLLLKGCIAWNISLEDSWNAPRRERPRDSTFPRITLPRVRRLRFDDVLKIAKYETWVL
ncbi:hypothetical protein BC826DRAFT_676515 [Russula brevipes]|nr:hypothetical protein BC826DRAFT_676515 [Russula brevipes]